MKTPTINHDLLPFKVHYLLKNAGSSFLPFIAPMSIERGISPEGVGLMWTINPVLSSLTNIGCGALADAYKLHRMLLLATCSLLAVSFTGFFLLPAVPIPLKSTNDTSIFVQCAINDSSFISCPTDVKHSFTSFESFPLCNANHSDFKSCDFKCKFKSPTKVETSLLKTNMSVEEPFFIRGENICSNRKCFVISHNNSIALLLNMSKRDCGKEFRLSCEDTCMSSEEQKVPLTYLLKTSQFWLNALCVMLICVAGDSSSSLADTMCMVVLGKNTHRYGETRLFGAIGWGVMGSTMGALVHLSSKDQLETDYTAAMIITTCLLFFNLIFTTMINVKVLGKEESNVGVCEILLSFPFIFLLTTTFIIGVTMGLIWTFEFIYIRNVSLKWDPRFSDMNLLQGLLVGTDCFLGEFPFMFLSTYIIKKLWHIHTFSLTLSAMSLRLLLYSFIENPWLFLPVHLLHGLSFGIFFTNMAVYVNLLAPKGAQATMQSTALACFTAGRSLGAFGGGMVLESLGGSRTFFTMGLIVSFYTIIYIIINCVAKRCNRNIKQDDELGEYQNANNKEKSEDTEKEIEYLDSNHHVNNEGEETSA